MISAPDQEYAKNQEDSANELKLVSEAADTVFNFDDLTKVSAYSKGVANAAGPVVRFRGCSDVTRNTRVCLKCWRIQRANTNLLQEQPRRSPRH
jgi:hypothetical protein